MGKADLPKRSLFRKALPVNTPDPVLTVNGKKVALSPDEMASLRKLEKALKAVDRHKPGYMAEYMRKRRAAK